MTEHIRKLAAVEKLAGDTTTRIVPFVLSTSEEDRAGDVVNQKGWQLENYLKNPVVFWGHETYKPPIGRMLDIGVKGGKLVGNVEFATAEQYPFADTVFQLVKGGFIHAGSVGFKPLKYNYNEKNGIDFDEQELLEFSIVGVPCNPSALRKAAELGVSSADAAQVLIEQQSDDEARAKLLALAKAAAVDKAAKSLSTFLRAVTVRDKEFQLGRRQFVA